MIRKSGYRFSEKIMLKQKDRAGSRFEEKSSRSRSGLRSSSSAKAVDPVRRAAKNAALKSQITGCPAFAEHDGGENAESQPPVSPGACALIASA
jgi:hypothetical protein